MGIIYLMTNEQKKYKVNVTKPLASVFLVYLCRWITVAEYCYAIRKFQCFFYSSKNASQNDKALSFAMSLKKCNFLCKII